VIATEERSRVPIAFMAGIGIVALLIGAAILVNHFSTPAGPQVDKPLPMGTAEQSYAPQIQFLEPKMSRAANFLNQEVTFVFGTVQNGGQRKIRMIEVTLEFHDVFNQVVLRDKQRLWLPDAPPLKPGEQRDFQITYETMPAQWNQVYPTIHITGLDLN
jgi:hypothetical protein